MGKLLKLWKRYSYIVLFVFLILSLFDLRFALAAIICMLGPIVVSIFKGRFGVETYVQGEVFMTMYYLKLARRKRFLSF